MFAADPLFQPTLRPVTPGADPDATRPFRSTSLIYLAFFGGGFALAPVVFMQARRLGEPRLGQWMAIAAAGIAFGVLFGSAVLGQGEGTPDSARTVRLVHRALVSVAAIAMVRRLRSADRRYVENAPIRTEPESLWVPGFIFMFAGNAIGGGFTAIAAAAWVELYNG